ncbi:MAG: hypothetical protein HUN05_16790 [Desulfobacter sp.]|nr:MAG: hypothetical protein HUN05_16790 [Desulfobacter sp.]
MVKRIQGLSDEQLKIIEMICFKREYTVKDILEFVQSIKKFGTERILALRVFADIDGVGPGPLNQFFTTTLVKGQRGKIGEEAYTEEVKEKMMTPD